MSTAVEVSPDTKIRLQPPFNVIVKNDEYHSMGFVIMVLMKVFSYDSKKSLGLMLAVHNNGQAVVWTGAKEVAELKAEQITSYREENFGPLDVVIEPAE